MAKKKDAKKKTVKKKATKKKAAAKEPAVKRTKAARNVRPKSVQAALNSLAGSINKKSVVDHGYEAAGEYYSDITEWVSTGCTPFDVQLWGGFPRGRVNSIEGDPSQGKSTLMESTFAENSKVGGINVLLMSESCLDYQRMQRQGILMDSLLPLTIDTFEQGVFYIHDTLKQRETFDLAWCKEHPLIIAWDTPSNAQEQHIFDDPEATFAAGMASKARSMRGSLRTIVPLAGRLNVTLILLFQQHQKIGPYGGKEVDCGGGPKFNASLRVTATSYKSDNIFSPTISDQDIGIVSKFYINKSKAGCPPFREADSIIRSWDGIDNDASMFRFLRESWVVDPCPTCGGKIPDYETMKWEKDAWRSCEACNKSGDVFRLLDLGDGKGPQPQHVCAEGQTVTGSATQWRYIYGFPGEEKITTTEAELHDALDARPGLRTWMAQQCWKRCSKPEPAVFHSVE